MFDPTCHSGRVLPPEITDAISEILAGSTASAQESETLDFKEDPSRSLKADGRGNDAKLVEFLLDECVCLANGDAGDAHVVLGVADKVPGREALTGTDRDPEWLVDKVFHNIRPSLRVEADTINVEGARLVWIRIPAALTVYERTKGQATRRVGTSCVPLLDAERRALITTRANPDFTAIASELDLDDLDPIAIAEARYRLSARRTATGQFDQVPQTTYGLLDELGLLTRKGELTVAAEILMAPMRTGRLSVRHLLRPVPGGEPRVREISSPLVLAFREILDRISENASPEIDRIDLEDGQEVPLPAFPAKAVDEVVANALIHRDWNLTSPVVVDQSPRTLAIWSPGPLPYGVTVDNLLTTVSRPRNLTLMAAMRMLGLAEESSRGFDRMWASMLVTGRRIPEVEASQSSVQVTLSAGRPDKDFVLGVHRLTRVHGEQVIHSVFTLIVLRHLFDRPLMTLREVAFQTQQGELAARELMEWLEETNLVQPVSDSVQEWVLTDEARGAFALVGKQAFASVSVQEWLEAKLNSGETVIAREAAEELGVDRREITGILSHLRNLGRAIIDPAGPQRGPSTRWVAPALKEVRGKQLGNNLN